MSRAADRRRSVRDANAGVTLVEIMVVLVVIALGIMTLSAVQTRSSSDVYSTGRSARALALAQARMEFVRGVGYAAAVSDSGQTDGLNWSTTLTPLSTDLKQVNVTVTWTVNGANRSIRLDNLLSNR